MDDIVGEVGAVAVRVFYPIRLIARHRICAYRIVASSHKAIGKLRSRFRHVGHLGDIAARVVCVLATISFGTCVLDHPVDDRATICGLVASLGRNADQRGASAVGGRLGDHCPIGRERAGRPVTPIGNVGGVRGERLIIV